jgi:hypothetical protein
VDGRNGARLDNGGALDGVAAVAVAAGGRGSSVGRGGDRGTDNGGRDGGGGGGNNDGLGLDLAVVLGDTELGGVLVLAVDVVNQLETVVGGIGLEIGRGGPGEGARVGDADGKGSTEGNDVGRGATEKDQGDGVPGSGLPGDLEGLAGRDDLWGKGSVWCFVSFQTGRTGGKTHLDERAGDGVALGLANGGVLGSDSAGEESNDGGLGEHGDGLFGGLFGWY